MKILLISTSLNPRSRSRVLASRAQHVCGQAGADTSLVDLQELSLPLAGTEGSYEHAEAVALGDRIREADGVLIATPIYNYDTNAACKNVIELTGDAWENKVVGFLCVAGGHGSFMSIMSLGNSLMLDFRCVIVPRFVYATSSTVRDGAVVDSEIEKRIEQLCKELIRLAAAMKGLDESGDGS
jgi:FMN reductase